MPNSEYALDREYMVRAMAEAERVRYITSPNPWVGALVVTDDGRVFEGATSEVGGPHAERVALAAAGEAADGATLYSTLEPCSHHGRTPPCVDAIIEAGIVRVVVGVLDPDDRVAGSGVDALEHAGIEVEVGVASGKVEQQLAPYLHHRRTGRPWVILKLAASLDGRTAATDGTSKWITSAAARSDGHRLRAESDAILVGAGTVRHDDPSLTVRDWRSPNGAPSGGLDPRRVVLGTAPPKAKVRPCTEMSGDLGDILDRLGDEGVVQLLVEGGADVAGQFHRAGLVNRYVLYLAPVLFGGDDGRGMFAGSGAWSIEDVWRGEIVSTERLGPDLRVELAPSN